MTTTTAATTPATTAATTAATAGMLLGDVGRATAAHDWVALRRLLADDAQITFVHTGEQFDPDQFVALVRDYPGAWTYRAEEVVDGGDRAVLHSRTAIGDDTWHCATFASVDRRDPSRLTQVVEVWTEAVAPHPGRSTVHHEEEEP